MTNGRENQTENSGKTPIKENNETIYPIANYNIFNFHDHKL